MSAGGPMGKGLRARLWRHRSAGAFAASNLVSQVTSLLAHLWVLTFIRPEDVGIWAYAVLLEQYLAITQFGVLNAMNREFPFYRATGDEVRAQKILQCAQAYALTNALFMAGVFVTLSLVLAPWGWQWSAVMLSSAVVAMLGQYTNYLEGTYRTAQQFGKLAMVRFGVSAVLLATVALPAQLGFAGFCWRLAAIAAASAILAHLWRPERVWPRWHASAFAELISTGWRLFLWNYLLRLSQSFPRLCLGLLAGQRELGLFVPVNLAYQALSNIADSFGAYLYPRLTREYASNRARVPRLALWAALCAAACLLPLSVVGVVILPWVVDGLLPQFTEATTAMQLALLASLFESVGIATISFAAAKAWRVMLIYVSAAVVVRGAAALLGVMLAEDRVLGVAWGILAASVVMALVTWLLVRSMPQNAATADAAPVGKDEA